MTGVWVRLLGLACACLGTAAPAPSKPWVLLCRGALTFGGGQLYRCTSRPTQGVLLNAIVPFHCCNYPLLPPAGHHVRLQ